MKLIGRYKLVIFWATCAFINVVSGCLLLRVATDFWHYVIIFMLLIVIVFNGLCAKQALDNLDKDGRI